MIIKRKISKNWMVIIPREIREILGLRKGGYVIFEIVNSEVKIRAE